MKATRTLKMIQQRPSHTSKRRAHARIGSARCSLVQAEGLPVCYGPHPHCGLRFERGPEVGAPYAACFPVSCQSQWGPDAQRSSHSRAALHPISSHGSAWFPSALVCSDLGTSAPTVPPPHQPLPSEPSGERNPQTATEIAPCLPENRGRAD